MSNTNKRQKRSLLPVHSIQEEKEEEYEEEKEEEEYRIGEKDYSRHAYDQGNTHVSRERERDQ